MLLFLMNTLADLFSQESKQMGNKNANKCVGKSDYYNNEEWIYRVESIIEREEGIKEAYTKFPKLPKLIITGVYIDDINDFWKRFYLYISANKSTFPNLNKIIQENNLIK